MDDDIEAVRHQRDVIQSQIELIKHHKSEAEKAIMKILGTFRKQTGFVPDSIELDTCHIDIVHTVPVKLKLAITL